MKRIVLMGFMGAGKSTVGKELARTLSWKLIDTDEWIESEQQRKISDIFEKEGEMFFRNLETELLKQLQKNKESFVLSIGGGMPVREENRALLRKIGTVVYLKTSKEEIIRRVTGNTSRPLLQGEGLEQKVTALMKAREDIYKETAHKTIMTDGKFVSELVNEIIKIK